MNIVRKLVWANILQHPARLILTSLSVVAASCVVIWVVSGYDALLAQFETFAPEYLGRYELVVVADVPGKRAGPVSPPGPPISEELIAAIRQDPAVASLAAVMQVRIKSAERLERPRSEKSRAESGAGGPDTPPGSGGKKKSPWRPRPTLEGTNAGQPPYPLAEGEWINLTRADRMEAVLSSKTANQLEVGVGDELEVESEAGRFKLKIIGLVEQVVMGGPPQGRWAPTRVFGGPATSALYVPVAVAEKIGGKPAEVRFVNIDLKDGSDVAKFRAKWLSHIEQEKYQATLLALGDVEDELKSGFSSSRVRSQAYSATGIALLASLFIILTTLSMGVSERVRQFAVLRAVALTRGQIGSMIAAESLILAVVGWIGGLAAGWGLLSIIGTQSESGGGASLGIWAVGLSGACAFGGALAASILPAWKAMRISPLEAMGPRRVSTRPARLSAVAVAIGLVLIAVNPLLVFVVPIPDAARYGIYAALGCTSMAIGFVLLAPLAILATERILGPLVAVLLRLDGRLLKTQLSGNLWQTLGTTSVLSLGLGLYVAMQVWGYSMLGPFVPGDWVPDMLVSFQLGGLPDEEIEAVRRIPGVNARQCLPLAVEQPKLAEDITGSQERATVARQNNVIMVGLDPTIGLGGPDPLVKLKFVQGNRDEAVEKLKRGRYCIVPDHFARESKLGLGDRFKLLPPESPKTPVEYTIAGVVELPGWHWMTKFSGLRRRDGRSAAMVFAPYDEVRRDFNLQRINFFCFNTEKTADEAAIGAALRRIADRHPGEKQPVNAQGTWAVGATMFGSSVRVTTAEQVSSRIGARADGMIWDMSLLPLVTLAVASLGVMNTVLASIRSRRWEMGVLRALGFTRLGLIRLILAEGLLIGLVACLLSLGFGVMAGWCGLGISRYTSFFGGLAPSLVLPWSKLAFGFAAALAICLAAALWPALATGRAEPLKLLQAGRASI